MPAARAADPVTLGPGRAAGVTVAASGTAYIAWIGNESNTTSLHFCRLPRGATACAINQPLTVPGTSLTRPYVVVDGATVRVLSYRYGLTSGPRFAAVYMLTSTDDGATFDAGAQIGTVAFHDAIRGPGPGVSLIENVGQSSFQLAPLDGSGPATASAPLAPDHPYDPSIALTGPGSLLAVFTNSSSQAQFRTFGGSGDPNDAASWTPAQDFAASASYPRLATGPAGTFVLSDNAEGNIEARRFLGGAAGFGAPVVLPLPAHESSGGSYDVTQDAGGRLHAVWPFGDADGQHVAFAVSDDGAKWRRANFDVGVPTDLAQAPASMRIAVAPDHIGVAVWDNGGGAGVAHAIAVGPDVAPPPPQRGRTATATPEKGTVLVKLPPGTSAARAKRLGLRGAANAFIPLEQAASVPIGSTFDTRRGTVGLATAAGGDRPDQIGHINGGRFVLGQTRKNPLTTLSMTGGNLGRCGTSVPRGGSPKPAARAAAGRKRKLFANTRGHFRTRGRHSAATTRGTRWAMTDSCAGTLTSVKSGSVSVRDFRLRKTRLVRAGHSYLARSVRKKGRGGR